MEKRIPDLDSLSTEAMNFATTLTPGSRATLVTLSGELGAGKTTFTQALASALGVEDVITSPTFVLEKIYDLPEKVVFRKLIHIDAYRLESGDALAPLDFEMLMRDPANLIVLEWPERVADALPTADVAITLTPQGDGSRLMTYA